jgi:hypothetical protein
MISSSAGRRMLYNFIIMAIDPKAKLKAGVGSRKYPIGQTHQYKTCSGKMRYYTCYNIRSHTTSNMRIIKQGDTDDVPPWDGVKIIQCCG